MCCVGAGSADAERRTSVNYLYSVSFIAETQTGYRVKAGSVVARNEDEARGKALRLCRDVVFPQSDGYSAHAVSIAFIGKANDTPQA